MDSQLSYFDQQLVQQYVTKLPYQDIADILDRPVEQIQACAEKYLEGKDIKPYNPLQKQSGPYKAKYPKEKKAKAEIPPRRIREIQPARAPKKVEKVFETKKLDYAQMRLLKIDNKTQIYIPLDQDPAEARAAYFKRIEDAKTEADIKQAQVTKDNAARTKERMNKLQAAKRAKYPDYYGD